MIPFLFLFDPVSPTTGHWISTGEKKNLTLLFMIYLPADHMPLIALLPPTESILFYMFCPLSSERKMSTLDTFENMVKIFINCQKFPVY